MRLVRQQKRIYLDLCALERPYDDQSYPRIAAETAAIILILSFVKARTYLLAYSPVHEEELEPNKDNAMRIEIVKLLKSYGEYVTLSCDYNNIEKRGVYLFQCGFGIADALHIAYAEACNAEFITCDDSLLRKCHSRNVTMWCGTPVDFGKKEGFL